MFDLAFYMKVYELKKRLMDGERLDKQYVAGQFEKYRSREPVIYNIETTNLCNMRCKMCPRTMMMTRPVETLDMETYGKVAGQIRPFTKEELAEWENFVHAKYNIPKDDMSENHFFLYIIPKVIVLHGYGEPFLDPHMPARVRILTEKGIPSYFSCNPANINFERCLEMFKNGLVWIKFSIESVDDLMHKKIRGSASNFTKGYEKIVGLLEEKKKRGYGTGVVITMLNLKRVDQREEYRRLAKAFEGMDVYIYLKSQDQQWYNNKYDGTQSLHWMEFCQFPWSSMTIKSNGEAAMCVEDFNNEIILGDARKESLYDIWNGEKYRSFRQKVFDAERGIKCAEQCDMKLIGDYWGQRQWRQKPISRI